MLIQIIKDYFINVFYRMKIIIQEKISFYDNIFGIYYEFN